MKLARKATRTLLKLSGVESGELPKNFYDLSLLVRVRLALVFSVALVIGIIAVAILVRLIG